MMHNDDVLVDTNDKQNAIRAIIELDRKLTVRGNTTLWFNFTCQSKQRDYESFCVSHDEFSPNLLLSLLLFLTFIYVDAIFVSLFQTSTFQFFIAYFFRTLSLIPCWILYFKIIDMKCCMFLNRISAKDLANIFIVLHTLTSCAVYYLLANAGTLQIYCFYSYLI